jgi:hypothetical protein
MMPPACVPYDEVVRWRRRFWLSAALNAALAGALVWALR